MKKLDPNNTLRTVAISFIIATLLIIAAQCGADSNKDGRRIIDYEAQVVCWTVYNRGISCLPISDTALSGERVPESEE